MSDLLKPLIEAEEQIPDRPYFPYSAALEAGRIVKETVKRVLDEPLGVILGNGRIPQQNDAGLIELGGDTYAVDHSQVLGADRKSITIGPSDKGNVNKETGQCTGEGLLTLTTPEGLMKVVGMVISKERAEWLKHAHNVGELAVIQFGLTILQYEITGVDKATGEVSAKPTGKVSAKPTNRTRNLI